jgi:hypothetical protein
MNLDTHRRSNVVIIKQFCWSESINKFFGGIFACLTNFFIDKLQVGQVEKTKWQYV